MGLRNSFKRWNTYQQTVRELNSLNNRELSDLGISRNDISRVARESASKF